MSYIGKTNAEKILPENTVDVIEYQSGNTQYTLSQEVPGAGESNIVVVRNGEILEPEVQYSIGYNQTTGKNDLLTFNSQYIIPALSESDVIFVVHRGSATYNLVPSPGSVTEDSLAENLRHFLYENFTGVTGQTAFTMAVAETVPASLIVTINGVVKTPWIDPQNIGDYYLDTSVAPGHPEPTTTLTFTVAPTNGAHVGVCHLAFTTVLRRASYPVTTITTPGSVHTDDIANDAVTGAKILLNNNEAIRSKNSGPGTKEIIKENASNQLELFSTIIIDTTKIEPKVTSQVDLGSSGKAFEDAYIETIHSTTILNSGDVTTEDLIVNDASSLHGDLEVQGTTTLDDVNINGALNVAGGIQAAIPVGCILMYYGNTAPANYLICNGQAITQQTYPTLYALCGAHVPDLRQRFPIGKKGTSGDIAADLGETGGSFTHIHEMQDHSHDLNVAHAIITDTGHQHDNGTLSVNLPAHVHYLNEHYHNNMDHSHVVERHFHTLDSGTYNTGNVDLAHTHGIRYKETGATGSGRYILPQTGQDGYFQTEPNGASLNHAHTIPAMTTKSIQSGGHPVPQNGGTVDISTRLSSLKTADTYETDHSRPYNVTRYNNHPNNMLDPGSMVNPDTLPGGPQVLQINGITDHAGASTYNHISGHTEVILDLVTQSNVVNLGNRNNGPQPYITLNFIIRAL